MKQRRSQRGQIATASQGRSPGGDQPGLGQSQQRSVTFHGSFSGFDGAGGGVFAIGPERLHPLELLGRSLERRLRHVDVAKHQGERRSVEHAAERLQFRLHFDGLRLRGRYSGGGLLFLGPMQRAVVLGLLLLLGFGVGFLRVVAMQGHPHEGRAQREAGE